MKRLVIYITTLLVVIALAIAIPLIIHDHNVKKAAELARQQEEAAAAMEAERIAQEQAQQAEEVGAYESVFLPNIYLDGELISGRGYDDVLADFTARYRQRLDSAVRIEFNGGEWYFTASEVGGSADVQQQVDAAWSYGHSEDASANYETLQDLNKEAVYLEVNLTYDSDLLHAFTADLKAKIDADPVDATMTVQGAGKSEITDSQLGYDLDLDSTEALLVDAVKSGSTEAIVLLPATIEPEVTEDQLAGTYRLLAEFTTSFAGSTNNRGFNIKHCLDRFNGLVVKPGETVSFNDVVGPRTQGRGFREAVEYINGQHSTGIGGGTCQASTTIYGAVLRAGLTIKQRSAHSLPVRYVPPSQDATVSNSGNDLVFYNNTSGPLYFYTSVNKEKQRATVSIYGTPIKVSLTIEIESEIIQPDIAAKPKYIEDTAGDYVWYADEEPVLKSQGQLGYKSCAYRVYYNRDGQEVKRELLSTDTYAATPAEYYVGVH